MAFGKLDGPGTIKMATLDDAGVQLMRLHSLVEQMALSVKQGQSTQAMGSVIKRMATPMVGLLKGYFGPISDTVTKLILDAGRSGGNEQIKVRQLREAVASIRSQIELATNKVKEQHTVVEAAPKESDSPI